VTRSGGVRRPHPWAGHPNAGHAYEGDWLSPMVGADRECTVMAWADAPGVWIFRSRHTQTHAQGGKEGQENSSESSHREAQLSIGGWPAVWDMRDGAMHSGELIWVPVTNWRDFREFRPVDDAGSSSDRSGAVADISPRPSVVNSIPVDVDILMPMPVSADGGSSSLVVITSITWLVVIAATTGAGMALILASGGAVSPPPANPSSGEALA